MNNIIDREADLTYLCKYQPASVVFILDDKKIVLQPTNILSIEKLDDYESNLRSILKISIRIDIRKKLWIMKNKNDIRCKFELNAVGVDYESEDEITTPRIIFNSIFNIYFNDDDENVDAESLELSLEDYSGDEFQMNDIEDENYFASENIMDIYLFDRKLMNASNTMYNDVYTKGPMQNFIARLLTKTKHKRVLMSPLQNTEIYQEMLVPSNKAYLGLMYLDQKYGFYKKGSIIYYDTDILYILNANGKCTAKQRNEWSESTFLVTSRGASSPGNGMVYKQNEKVYYMSVSEDDVTPDKISNSKNDTVGSEAKIVIADSTDIDSIEADQSTSDQRNENVIYILKDNNKFTPTMIKARMEENECIFRIKANNLDINAFTPNKSFKIIFEDTGKHKKYSKYLFRLAYAHHYIKAESTERMTSYHYIILKRCGRSDKVTTKS